MSLLWHWAVSRHPSISLLPAPPAGFDASGTSSSAAAEGFPSLPARLTPAHFTDSISFTPLASSRTGSLFPLAPSSPSEDVEPSHPTDFYGLIKVACHTAAAQQWLKTWKFGTMIESRVQISLLGHNFKPPRDEPPLIKLYFNGLLPNMWLSCSSCLALDLKK